MTTDLWLQIVAACARIHHGDTSPDDIPAITALQALIAQHVQITPAGPVLPPPPPPTQTPGPRPGTGMPPNVKP